MKFSLFFAVAIAIGLLAVQSDLSAQSVKERTLGKKGTHPTSRNLHESPKGLNAVNVKVAIASPPDLTQILYENRGTDGNWESGVASILGKWLRFYRQSKLFSSNWAGES